MDSTVDGEVATRNGAVKLGALDQAADPARHKGAAGLVVRALERVLDAGIDGRGPVASAAQVAGGALAATSSPEAAIDHIVRTHVGIGAAGGFVTGVGGLFTLPLALPANVAEFYLTATRMVAAIACVRGYDVSQEQVRAAVLLTIVGAEADDLLRRAGVVAPGGRTTRLMTRRLPGPAVMIVNKALAFRVVTRVLRTGLTRAARIVPVLGGALGAGLDGYLLKRIADQAREEFPPRAA